MFVDVLCAHFDLSYRLMTEFNKHLHAVAIRDNDAHVLHEFDASSFLSS